MWAWVMRAAFHRTAASSIRVHIAKGGFSLAFDVCHSSHGTPSLKIVFCYSKPDEEIGGADGMGQLLASPDELGSLQPIGFALDEGLANPRNAFTVFYGERTPWWLLVRAKGPTVIARFSSAVPPPQAVHCTRIATNNLFSLLCPAT